MSIRFDKVAAVDSGVNNWQATLYPKRGVEATGYLLAELCIRLNPLLIQGECTVATVVISVVRFKLCQ